MIVIPFHSYLLKMSAIGHSLPQIWAIVITSKTETKVEKKRKKKVYLFVLSGYHSQVLHEILHTKYLKKEKSQTAFLFWLYY